MHKNRNYNGGTLLKVEKLLIENYKLYSHAEIDLNSSYNIFVGNNDSGKSTILEVLEIVLSGKLNRFNFERQIKLSHFNIFARKNYLKFLDDKNISNLPTIIIESYLSNGEDSLSLKGTNNSLGIDCPGIRFEVSFDQEFAEIYKDMINNDEIHDIPIELYKVTWHAFNGERLLFKKLPLKLAIIDTTKKDYTNAINRFVNTSITENLNQNDRLNLSKSYQDMRHNFNSNETVKELNQTLLDNNTFLDGKNLTLSLKDETVESWIDDISVNIEDIPYENLGFGTQNMMKIALNYARNESKTSIILFEEPENNLSFSNMNRLVNKLNENEEKQIFISTHSSFIANKLNLSNLFILDNGKCASLKNLDTYTQDYFKKLPGYDTVRILLSDFPILVEGPTDELILQRFYRDMHAKLPIEDGIDILVVDSLAFKRYCDIANLLNKKIKILTDNDGSIKNKIEIKYKEYLNNENISLFYEENENLTTLEPSILEKNSQNEDDFNTFKNIIGKNNSLKGYDKERILSFMTNNKTLWGLRVFDSIKIIKYPKYIHDLFK